MRISKSACRACVVTLVQSLSKDKFGLRENIFLTLPALVPPRCPVNASWAYGIWDKPYLRARCRCNGGIRISLLTLNKSAGCRNGRISKFPRNQHNGSGDKIPCGLKPICFSCLFSRPPQAHHAPAEKSILGRIYNWTSPRPSGRRT